MLKDEELPSSILCHRCMEYIENKQSKSEASKVDASLKRKRLEDDQYLKQLMTLKREKLQVKGSIFHLDGHGVC